MIRINMLSQADSVQGQGVGPTYKELIRLLRTRLIGELYVAISKYRRSGLTRYHAISPAYFINDFLPSRDREIGYVHFLPETLEGSVKLPGPTKSIFYKYIINFYRGMDQIVVVNPISIDKLVKYGINEKKVKYVPNFVAKSEFYEQSQVQKNAFRDKLNTPLDRFVIVGGGQVQRRKSVNDFVKLAGANPNTQLVWVGGFSFRKMMDGYAHFKKIIGNPPKSLKFAETVPREELVSYLNIADLFLLPSFDELSPMPVLEAFSRSAPVLLRGLDLYQTIIGGHYMRGKNFEELNAQTKSVISNPEEMEKYRKLSVKASQEYSEDHLAKIWCGLYMEQYEIDRKLGQIK